MKKLTDSEKIGNSKLDTLVQIAIGQKPVTASAEALVRRGLAEKIRERNDPQGAYVLTERGQGALLMLRTLAVLHPGVAASRIDDLGRKTGDR